MLALRRLSSDFFGTYGVFIVGRKVACHALELPWKNNLRNISCIPDGDYLTMKSSSGRFGTCFRVLDVPDREGILIHVGNTTEDTHGCILPGLDVSPEGVLNSRQALDRLWRCLPDRFNLSVRSLDAISNSTL